MQRASEHGIEVEVESAGTADYHIGEPPHRLTRAEAATRGIPMDHRGQQFTVDDFARFDLVVAMDHSNEQDLIDLAPDEDAAAKVVRFGTFEDGADARDPSTVRDVRDPWGHGPEVFAAMYDHLEAGMPGLLERVRAAASQP